MASCYRRLQAMQPQFRRFMFDKLTISCYITSQSHNYSSVSLRVVHQKQRVPLGSVRFLVRKPVTAEEERRAKIRDGLMYSLSMLLFMIGVSFAAVPLYKMFCSATGDLPYFISLLPFPSLFVSVSLRLFSLSLPFYCFSLLLLSVSLLPLSFFVSLLPFLCLCLLTAIPSLPLCLFTTFLFAFVSLLLSSPSLSSISLYLPIDIPVFQGTVGLHKHTTLPTTIRLSAWNHWTGDLSSFTSPVLLI